MVEGAESVTLTPEGGLVASAGDAELRQSRPVLYQQLDGARRTVDGWFILTGPNRFGFHVGGLRPKPAARHRPRAVVVDRSRRAVRRLDHRDQCRSRRPRLCDRLHHLTRLPDDQPVPARVRDAATTDAFVAKLNPAGNGLLWSTCLGGGLADEGAGIAVDGAGNATVVGSTSSTNFPSVNPYQPAKGAGTAPDAFVVDPGASGAASLLYSSYLGGGADDVGAARGRPCPRSYITGETRSDNFPTAAALKARSPAPAPRPTTRPGCAGRPSSPNSTRPPAGRRRSSGPPIRGDHLDLPFSGGTPVVITGTGFNGITSVLFGGVAAWSFRVETPNRIVAVSPGGTGPERVTVSTTVELTLPKAPHTAPLAQPGGRFASCSG